MPIIRQHDNLCTIPCYSALYMQSNAIATEMSVCRSKFLRFAYLLSCNYTYVKMLVVNLVSLVGWA